jgi:predicted permease
VVDALKSGRGAGEGSGGGRTRSLLVVAEVALAVVLLVSAGLTVRTFFVLQQIDTGIGSKNLLLVGVPLPGTKYDTLERRNIFAQQLLERVSGLPGVEAVSIGNGGAPFGGPQSPVSIAGDPSPEQRRVQINLVGADHLRAFGIPLRIGRMFDATEVRRGERVAVVNEAASRFWPAGQSPIGARVRLGLLDRPPQGVLADTSRSLELTIVGMTATTRNAGLRDEPSPAVLIPYSLIAPSQRLLAVRTAGDPNQLLEAVRAEVRAIDPAQPLGRPTTLDRILEQQVIQPRFIMALFSAFAAFGLALAASGIYGVLSFHVARRTRELGLRMALGASRGHVLALMLGMGGRLVAVGLILGIAISVAASRLVRSQLVGVSPGDPLAYAAVTVLLGAVALAACYLPARRAAAVDPMTAIREE